MRNKPYPTYTGIELKEDFFSILSYCSEQYGDRNAISFRINKSIEKRTFNQLLTDSLKLASYISSFGLKSKNIAIISPNSYEWIVTFFAIQFCGNIVVPINHNIPDEEIRALLSKVDASAAFAAKKQSILHDLCAVFDIDSIIQNAEKMECYQEISASNEPSMIFFTSGSTGKNKGVMLTQQNICFDVFSMTKYCYPHDVNKAIQTLPFYHTLGLSTFIYYLLHGMETFIESSTRHLVKDLKEVSPSVSTWVPAFAEGIYNNILRTIDSPRKKFLYILIKAICNVLLWIGIDVRRRAFHKIHEKLGGNLKFICCGGARIREKIVKEFRAWGIYIMPGYGITECSPVISATRNYYWRDGSVGLVLPGISVKISSDGEILVKGRNLFSGYYGDEQSTRDVFDSEGWFKTGDIGHLDKDGFLYITGRKKKIILLSSGENISPDELVEKLSDFFPEIIEVIVFDEENKIVAEAFVDNDESKNAVSSGLTSFNRTLSPDRRIHEIRFRNYAFSSANNEKVKRTYMGAGKNVREN